jgi:hypothetical protein
VGSTWLRCGRGRDRRYRRAETDEIGSREDGQGNYRRASEAGLIPPVGPRVLYVRRSELKQISPNAVDVSSIDEASVAEEEWRIIEAERRRLGLDP